MLSLSWDDRPRMVVRDLLLLPCLKIQCYTVGVEREKGSVSLKNARTCGGTADVQIAARDWLFFSQSWGT